MPLRIRQVLLDNAGLEERTAGLVVFVRFTHDIHDPHEGATWDTAQINEMLTFDPIIGTAIYVR